MRWLFAALVVGLCSGPGLAAAEPGPDAAASAKPSAKSAGGKPTGPKAGTLAHALSELACDDEARIAAALSALREDGSSRIGAPIVERMRDGLPPALLLQAIGVLAETNQRSAAAGLSELLAHRRPEIRRAAVEALGMLGQRGSYTALVAALEDPAAPVQEAAAAGLMVLGEARAVPALLAAHDRGVKGAIEAVGELAAGPHVSELSSRAKGAGLDGLSPALERMLQRQKLATGIKVKLVQAVAASESPTAGMHLARWLQTAASPPLARALREAVGRIEARKAEPLAAAAAAPAPAREATASPVASPRRPVPRRHTVAARRGQ